MARAQTRFTEVDQSSIRLAKGAIVAFAGPAMKGTLGGNVLLSSVPEMKYRIGTELADDNTVALVRRAIEAGCRVRFSRSVHMTDVGDFDTRTSVPASKTIEDNGTTATGAVQTTAETGLSFNNGDKVTVDVNSVETDVDFNGVAATVESGAETYDFSVAGYALQIKVDQGGTQYVDLLAGDFVDPANATAAEVCIALNDGRMAGANAVEANPGKVTLISDSQGSASYIQVVGGTANAALGFSTTEQASAGPNTFPNIKNVSAEDLYDYLVANPIAGLTPTYSAPTLTLTTDATGAAVYLGFNGDAVPVTQWGWTDGAPGRTYGGDVAAGQDTLTVTAREEGSWANGMTITISDASDVSDANLFKMVISANTSLGILAETYDNIAITDVEGLVSAHWLFTDESSPNTPPDNRPANGSYVLASGADGATGMTATTRLGVEAFKTGIYGLNSNIDFIDAFVPGLTANTQQRLFDTWATAKDLVAHQSVPAGLSPTDVQDFRKQTGAYAGGTEINSSFSCMHWGELEFVDELSASGETAFYENSGAMAGVLATNDALVVGDSDNVPGPWLAPSGKARGKTRAVSLLVQSTDDEKDAMDEQGINWFEEAEGIVRARGNLTLLREQKKTMFLNVRRCLCQFRRDVKPLLDNLLDDPVDTLLWRKGYRAIKTVADRYAASRAFQGGEGEGYFINCDQEAKNISDGVINTADVVDAGEFHILFRCKPVGAVKLIDFLLIVDSTGVNYTEL